MSGFAHDKVGVEAYPFFAMYSANMSENMGMLKKLPSSGRLSVRDLLAAAELFVTVFLTTFLNIETYLEAPPSATSRQLQPNR